jgi:predicted 3-demethylubiquinone-9 3-methyltransferase (glyoxalase superfamily)
MGDSNPAKAQSVTQAMLQMKKIIVADLQKAYDGV